MRRRLLLAAEINGDWQGGGELNVARIAERFAPTAQPSAAPPARDVADERPAVQSSSALPRGVRTLIVVLILVALIPNVTLGALLWLGVIDTPWSPSTPPSPIENKAPAIAQAATADIVAPASGELTQPARLPVILTAPATLEATAGVEPIVPVSPPAVDAQISDAKAPASETIEADQSSPAPGDAEGAAATSDDAVLATGDSRDPNPSGEGSSAAEDPSQDPVQSPQNGPVQPASEAGPAKSITLAEFVNLRSGPSASARVVGVIAKGTKLPITGRKHGWVQVIDPATSKEGWVYAGTAVGSKSWRGAKRASHSDSPPADSDSDSVWTRLGRWLTEP